MDANWPMWGLNIHKTNVDELNRLQHGQWREHGQQNAWPFDSVFDNLQMQLNTRL